VWLLEHLGRMAQHTILADGKTPIRTLEAKAHGREPDQAGAIQQIRRTPCRLAETKPMQRGAATGFEVRLIPHGPKLLDAAPESKSLLWPRERRDPQAATRGYFRHA
jgi:hypothetical protein